MNITVIDDVHLDINTTNETITGVLSLIPGVDFKDGILTLPFQLPFCIRLHKYIEQYYPDAFVNMNHDSFMGHLGSEARHPIFNRHNITTRIYQGYQTYVDLYQMTDDLDKIMLSARDSMPIKMKLELLAKFRNMRYKTQQRKMDKKNCLILNNLIPLDTIHEIQKYL